jgi:hypothetical protein
MENRPCRAKCDDDYSAGESPGVAASTRLTSGKETAMDAHPEPRLTSSEILDTEDRSQQFVEAATQLNEQLDAYLDGQQVTRESLDLVISI